MYTASSYPTMTYQPNLGQTSLQQETSIVPATRPNYANYQMPAEHGDLMSFATPPAPTYQSLAEAQVLSPQQQQQQQQQQEAKDLQKRDEAFVQSLPSSIVQEQQRILDQIQKSNTSATAAATAPLPENSVIPYYHETNHNNDSSLPNEIHPRRYQMKEERKLKTAVGATTGAIVGGLITGPAWPIGAAAGAAVGGYATKVTARAGERRQQRKWDQKNMNEFASRGVAGVQSDSVSFA